MRKRPLTIERLDAREMMAPLAFGPDLVPIYGETPTALAAGGRWSDPAAWTIPPPGPDEAVHVPAGIEVVIDGEASALSIVVAGTLRLADGAELRVGTLTVLPQGRLLAHAADGIQARIWIRPQPFDAADFAQWGRGILVAGSIDLAGVPAGTPELGNLGRSLQIASEDPARPGHVVVGGGAAEAYLFNVALVNLGRTTNAPFDNARGGAPGSNQIGRYALHFHHFGGSMPPIVAGCALVGGVSRWGLVIHHTNHGYFARNTVAGFAGAGIIVESGEERGNVIEENLVAGARGSGQAVYFRTRGRGLDIGHDGAGIWLRSGLNTVRGNIIADCDKGIAIVPIDVGPRHDGMIDLGGTAVLVNGLPIEVLGNRTSGCRVGVFLWEVGARIVGNRAAPAGDGPFQVVSHVSRGDRSAVELRWTSGVEIVGLDAIGDGDRRSIGIETNGSNGNTLNRNVRIVNPSITGFALGVQAPAKAGLPGEIGTLTVVGGLLRNAVNVLIAGVHLRRVETIGCDLYAGVAFAFAQHRRNTAGAVERVFADGRALWRDGDPATPAEARAEPWLAGGKAA